MTLAALILVCGLAFAAGGSHSLLRSEGQDLSFSFTYDGRGSGTLLRSWPHQSLTKRLDSNREQVTTTWTDPASGLQVRCVAITYSDQPAVEWTLYFKNTGLKDTPIIERVLALDSPVDMGTKGDVVLRHNVGSPANGDDYSPLETPLVPGSAHRFGGAGGRPTNSDMSYFNVDFGKQGMIVVVGWPGQWSAQFGRSAKGLVSVKAGQELTHFRLHPGEEVRTPLMVLLEWHGDWIDGQNDWRRWMMAYGMPKPGGKLPHPIFVASSSRAYREMIGANEANQIMSIDRYRAEGLKLDYWWMDAGWYIQTEGWPQVGTWEVDPKRFPHGFRPISDRAHSQGVKTLVWFEPERVAPRTWLADNHPEWVLNPRASLASRRSSELGTGEPCVVFNTAAHPVDWNGIHWPAHGLSFHPGPKGEYSVVRFTAPQSGTYGIKAVFSGIDDQTTTDVHVLANGRSLFDAFIRLHGADRRAASESEVSLSHGQTIDFVVGYGNGTYEYDSTGVDAEVTGPDGTPHDAAKEYGTANGSWSYGYLKPGETPDATTFRPYDRVSSGSDGGGLLDLGNPAARKWLTNHVDKLLTDNGIDLYRQDFNMDPLSYWRGNDAPDRQGITEIKHVMGYLAYWDELRRRHPNMLIDSCASGGRRNDLETMRRAVPLWRSDYAYEPIGHQSMTYGISMWLPFHGTGTVADENAPYYGGGVTPIHPYAFWSNTAPSLGCGIDIRETGIDYVELRKLVAEWRSIGPYYYSDYYPLTPCTRQDDNWIAWQFNRSSDGDGIVEAFRRPKASNDLQALKLRGLDAGATYSITVIDGAAPFVSPRFTGKALMENGLPVRLAVAPGAAIIRYARLAR